ncbi:MAG: hypothetical protein Q8P41_06575 [Pseudomonadota bacterium]|nr:hypothetical protein [Pseudomonadota bacterium]
MIFAIATASAAGFHFVRAEVIGGVTGQVPEGGVGASFISDALHGWATFGDPAVDRHLVRAWRVGSSFLGPVLGVVPPTFRGMVPRNDVPFALPWVQAHLGGEAAAGKLVEADVSGHYVLNVPGFWDVDPRRAYVGPSAGLGLNGTWWEGWRGDESGVVMTGKATGEAGFLAGVTLRDTWYAQGRAVVSLDLFGAHQSNLGVAATTGVFLDRVGIPVGVEVRGELDRGNDTVTTEPATRWAARLALFWKLTPPFQTKIEEDLERRRREAAAAAARGAGS